MNKEYFSDDQKHTYILGVDPGTHQTGWVLARRDVGLGPNLGLPIEFGVSPNVELLERLPRLSKYYGMRTLMVMEYPESRGQGFFGKEAIRTVWWAGRFREAWGRGNDYVEIYPREVKRVICGAVANNDAGIRRAVIDRYPGLGGGKEPAIGVKKNTGPLYGLNSHCWRALAAVLTWLEEPEFVLQAQKSKNLTPEGMQV